MSVFQVHSNEYGDGCIVEADNVVAAIMEVAKKWNISLAQVSSATEISTYPVLVATVSS